MGPHAAASRPMTLSEQADELEEQMMHELNDKIATKSVLFTLTDGQIDMEGGAQLLAKNPGKYFLMGADPRLPTMPEKPTLIDFFKHRFASTNHLLQSATLALKTGHRREGRAGVPAARHRRGQLHPLRPRLLGRADDRALCRRGGELVDPRAPGAAVLPRRVGGLRLSRHVREVFRRRLQAGAVYRGGIQARPQSQVLHDGAADLRERHLLVRSRTPRSTSTISSTSSGATSGSRKKASASTTARRRTCGAR